MHQKTLLVPAAQISFVFLFVHLLLAFSTLLLCRSVSDIDAGKHLLVVDANKDDAEVPRAAT